MHFCMKVVLGMVALIVLGAVAFVMWSPEGAPAPVDSGNKSEEATGAGEATVQSRAVVTEGEYVVRAEESRVSWAGKKPLIEGYVNSGTLGVTEGTIWVGSNTATGTFTIDMNTLTVSNTPTKPGRETMLEGHLKGEGWFNVEEFPEASFVITEVTPRADSDTTFVYDVGGDLTMKGVTNELAFPVTIYLDEAGLLHASANFEFDRTKWGITAGSGSFFDNLADNVIADMVALSFELVAEKN